MNIGGAPSVVFHQMQLIDKKRFEPHLLLLYPSKPANFLSQIDFIPKEHIKQFSLKRRSVFDFITLTKIFWYLVVERFDIVYTHLFLTNFLVRALAIMAWVPSIIVFEHSVYFNKSRWQIAMDRLLAHFTDRIVVSTESVRDFTMEQEGLPKSLFSVIRNPVVIPDRTTINITQLREEAGITENDHVFLTIGRFSEEKGQQDLLSAALLVHEKYPSATFLFVGHGPTEESLRAYVREHDMESYVHIVHAPNRAKEFLFLADWFVLPSHREGQAMVVEEAMTAGVPVIANKLSGMGNAVEDGKNGFTVETGNVDAMAAAIGRAIDLGEGRNAMSYAAHEKAKKQFSSKDRVAMLEKLCVDIVRAKLKK